MVILKSITKEHVIQAIAELEKSEFAEDITSTKYDLIWEGKKYPSQLLIPLAAKRASGNELNPKLFSGSNHDIDFLRSLGFDVKERRRDWSWEECYLAVWAYDQLDQDADQVKTVLYREVARLIGRSPGSIEFKIQNVSSFDPRKREEKPISEAANAQALLGDVFLWYWKDRDLARRQYWKIRAEFELDLPSNAGSSKTPPAFQTEIMIEEGAMVSVPSTRRKRSQKLLENGRAYFKKLDDEGFLRCQACGFVTPDGVLTEIVQLHHSEPIYEAGHDGRTISLEHAIKNLIPLCPTCHALAHTSKPPLKVLEIKEFCTKLKGSDSASVIDNQ